MLNKIRSTKGFTLVELMIVVAIIGILAAIAIPAFLRYIKNSKAAEAESIMKKMADGSKAYFTSEQKWSAPTGGDQPWHKGTAGSSTEQPGLPVVWDNYVFPGGASFTFISTGDACAVAGTMPSGGSKYIPCNGTQPSASANANHWAALNKLRVNVQDPLYFQYSYITGAVAGNGATATITAEHNFNTGSTELHTITQLVSIDSISQEVKASPTVLTNEFE